MDEIYLRVMAPVIPDSVDAILKILDERISRGCKRVHFLLSTPGGSVAHGIALANYLRSVPLEIYTYNFGTVDSIGVSVYCSGIRRFCFSQSRFMIHGIGLALAEKQPIDSQFLAQKSRELEVDTLNVASLISSATRMSTDEVLAAMQRQTILDAKGAIDCGLAHEIRNLQIPAGATTYAIFSNCSVAEYGTE